MLGEIKSLGDIITGTSNYSIPPYQRQYQWNGERWQAFVSDVSNSLTSNESDPQHWLGILLLSKDSQISLPGDSSPSNFAVIDGQQRLVTILVWIAALVHHAEEFGEEVDFELASLCNLTVQVSDQKPLEVVLKGLWQESQYESLRASQIVQAYRYFRYLLWLGSDAIAEEYEITIPPWKNPPENETYISMYEKFLNTAFSRYTLF